MTSVRSMLDPGHSSAARQLPDPPKITSLNLGLLVFREGITPPPEGDVRTKGVNVMKYLAE